MSKFNYILASILLTGSLLFCILSVSENHINNTGLNTDGLWIFGAENSVNLQILSFLFELQAIDCDTLNYI